LDKIRQSIELFSQSYPLAPEIWIRYLHNEAFVAQSEKEIEFLQSLFQRALNDYFNIDIALEYANLAARSSDAMAKKIWEQLLPAYGYEFTKGRLIWAAWREDFLKREPDSPDKFKKIMKRFKEELLLPLSEMQLTYKEFREFLDKYGDQLKSVDRESVEIEFKQTKQILLKVLPYEQKLEKLEVRSHQERVHLFKDYINDCAEELEEEYVQILYERMVTACCLNESVWKEYLKYIHNRSEDWSPVDSNKSTIFIQTDLDVVNRGLRNCNWSADLYIEKMRIFEQEKASRQEIQTLLETACAIQYNNAEPIVKVWLEYLSYLVRATNYSDEKEKEILRKNFKLSWDSLGRQYGDLADCDCEILRFWSRIEYTKFEDSNQGKQLWNTVMESYDNSTKTALWLEFAQLEHQQRGVDAARSVYKRALKVQELNDLPSMTSSWIRFERCHGSLDHLKSGQEICDKALYQYRKKFRVKKQEVKKDSKRKAEDEPTDGKKKVKETAKEQPAASKPKPKNVEDSSNGAGGGLNEVDLTKDKIRVFFSNLDFNVTTEDLKEAFPEITINSFNMITTGKGKSRGFG